MAIVIVIVILIILVLVYYNTGAVCEHMTVDSNEAIQNIASLYN